jgi:hypothetical protein
MALLISMPGSARDEAVQPRAIATAVSRAIEDETRPEKIRFANARSPKNHLPKNRPEKSRLE